MQKIGSCGGERFASVTLINQEKPVEEEKKKKKLSLVGPKIAKRQLHLKLAVQQYQILLKKPVLHYGQL